MWRVRLLGQFELRGPLGAISLPGSKLAAILAYLALSGKPVPREHLASVFWGSRFEEQARQSLRQALVRLRKVLGHAALISSEHSVELSSAAVECDILNFERLVRTGLRDDLRKAVGLLDGELLGGIDVRETGWEDWLGQEKRRIGKLVSEVLVKLATDDLDQGHPGEALVNAEACIARDFFREDAHRVAILAMAALGQRAEAVRHYQIFANRLKQELNTLPEPATTQAFEKIRSHHGIEPPATVSTARKPSIAVLPFANLSNDPEQEYFADGVVEEIITALSRLRWLFVIARNSSFTYKGRAVDVRQVGRELGVRYILEGSLRKAGDRVRIAGQLIDAETGVTLWADRFEGELQDLFDLQDQVTRYTMAAISPRLEEAEIDRSRQKPTSNLDAYDCYLRGTAGLHQFTHKGSEEALHYFRRAMELDPNFASAYGLAARCYTQRKAMNWMIDPAGEEAEAIRLAVRAAELGRDDAVALGTAGFTLAYMGGRHADGEALTDRALQLNPNYAWGWFFSGWIKAVSGEPDVAIERSTKALQLSPHDPHRYSFELTIATAHFIAGRYAEALDQAEKASRMQPDRFSTLSFRAASLAHLERLEEARVCVRRLMDLEPDIRLARLRSRFPIKHDEDYARWEEALRRAGLPP